MLRVNLNGIGSPTIRFYHSHNYRFHSDIGSVFGVFTRNPLATSPSGTLGAHLNGIESVTFSFIYLENYGFDANISRFLLFLVILSYPTCRGGARRSHKRLGSITISSILKFISAILKTMDSTVILVNIIILHINLFAVPPIGIFRVNEIS